MRIGGGRKRREEGENIYIYNIIIMIITNKIIYKIIKIKN